MCARVSGEWRRQPPEVRSVFCKGCVCLDFQLCLQWHSSSCAFVVLNTLAWAWAWAWQGPRGCAVILSTKFNHPFRSFIFSGDSFFSREQGRVKRLGMGDRSANLKSVHFLSV